MTHIIKNLKNFTWDYDLDKHELILVRNLFGVSESMVFEMDKTRMFSLFRFLIRISQKMSSKKRTKNAKVS